MARIKNDTEYKAIMKRVDELFFETGESTPSDDPRLVELDMLSSLVEEYEKETIPIKTPLLRDVLSDRMEQANCTQKEFAAILGISAPRFSDILTGKKTPTYQQARVISSKLGIDPVVVLAL